MMSKTNEWNLLKRQFDELARDDSAGPDSVELDADFHRRFAAIDEPGLRSLEVLPESQSVPGESRLVIFRGSLMLEISAPLSLQSVSDLILNFPQALMSASDPKWTR